MHRVACGMDVMQRLEAMSCDSSNFTLLIDDIIDSWREIGVMSVCTLLRGISSIIKSTMARSIIGKKSLTIKFWKENEN